MSPHTAQYAVPVPVYTSHSAPYLYRYPYCTVLSSKVTVLSSVGYRYRYRYGTGTGTGIY